MVSHERPPGHLFDEHALPRGADFIERGGDARGHLSARLVRDQRDMFVGLNRQTHFDGIARARFELD